MKKKLRDMLKNQDIYLAKKYIKSLFSEEFKEDIFIIKSDMYKRSYIHIQSGYLLRISYDILNKKGIYANVNNILKDFGKLSDDIRECLFVLEDDMLKKIFIEEEKKQLINDIKYNSEKKIKERL